MKNYKLVLGYDGTDFRGWQRQPRRPHRPGRPRGGGLQGHPEADRRPRRRAGPTPGVHALGQVAGFRGAFKLTDAVLLAPSTPSCPRTSGSSRSSEAPPDFHARRSARSKLYRYRIVRRAAAEPPRPPLRPPLALSAQGRRHARGRPAVRPDGRFHGLLLEPRPLARADRHPVRSCGGRATSSSTRSSRGVSCATWSGRSSGRSSRSAAGRIRAGRHRGDLPRARTARSPGRRPRPRD
ncbi:MAG: hypothetical protein MZU95_06955 [Desulfomicrobium escambiense]|nr:hypothetical protein [Desulfomicrobium escambiense]